MEVMTGTSSKKVKELELEGEDGSFFLKVEPVRNDIVRVRYAREKIKDIPSLLLDEKVIKNGQLIATEEFKITEQKESKILESEKLKLNIAISNGKIEWSNAVSKDVLFQEGKKVLSKVPVYHYTTGKEKPIIQREKTVDGERNFIQNLKKVEDRVAYRGQFHFCFQPKEGIYGFGQAEEGIYNLRHHNQYFYQHNMRIPMPMFFSTQGYGVFFDCCSLMTFEDNANESYLFMDTIEQMEYYVIMGPTLDEVIDGFRFLTGKAAMLPHWAFGYIQSKEQYHTAEELVSIVERYRSLNIPIDCVVQDWNSWAPGDWGEKRVDKTRYGNLASCLKKIHEMNAHAMVSIWPNMNSTTSNYQEMEKKGFILGDCATYDAFQKEARRLYWNQAKVELFQSGFDAWWCDSTEPFSGPDWNGEVKREPWERFELVGAEHKKYLDPAVANAYALVHAKGIYENQREETEEKRVLNLTRSGYASGQKYAAMLWSGDTVASWETLKNQIVEGLNMGISGYPYWTLDIGGFFTVGKKWQNRGCGCEKDNSPKWFWCGKYDEGVNDAGYRELYVRWFQLGTFLPMFRSHGTDTPREIWNFGSPGTPFYEAISKFIQLRYKWMPYIYSMAGDVWLHNRTIMRSLLFDFIEDEEVLTIKDEFLFGESILVCPVTEPMYYEAGNKVLQKTEKERTRSCYLPKGSNWIDYWSQKKYKGGQSIRQYTPLDQIPIFIKTGSIIPMKENLQYAMDKKKDAIILQIYPGASTEFTLYEDEGDSFRYEKGDYTTIKIEWQMNEVLIINDRVGKFEGMLQEREFIIRCENKPEKRVPYCGKKISVSW